MVNTKSASLALILAALALLSCAAPKAIVVQPAPQPKNPTAAAEPGVPEPEVPSPADDGIRLPDMLAMPDDGEFRATSPTAPKAGSDTSAVIARPPTDPPSRPKPKPAGND